MDIAVYSGPVSALEIVKKSLDKQFNVRTVENIEEQLLPEFEKCTVFLDASMKVPINAAAIAKARNLKLIVAATTGANHIDQDALAKRGIPLLTLKGQTDVLRNLTSAAEHSWLLLMACARKLRAAIHHVEEKNWERTFFNGVMLKDKTIGIIGLGRIGSWMARYAQAFDMKIQGYDPYLKTAPTIKLISLEELVASSDIISLHVNLTPENKGMITAELIKQFKKGAIFVNTSRGELVDETALVEGLDQGRIAAVGVDVVSGEPDIANNPLWRYSLDHNNVIITPHVGGFCLEAVDKVVEFSCQRIIEYFNKHD